MKSRSIFVISGLIAILYMGSVLVRSYLWEKWAEKYIEVSLLDVARPWSAEKLEKRASWGFIEKSKLKPSDIASLAANSLGGLVEIVENPKCNIQQGFDAYSDIKHTYAVCITTARFEKSTVDMAIRLQDDGDWKNGNWKINDFISIK